MPGLLLLSAGCHRRCVPGERGAEPAGTRCSLSPPRAGLGVDTGLSAYRSGTGEVDVCFAPQESAGVRAERRGRWRNGCVQSTFIKAQRGRSESRSQSRSEFNVESDKRTLDLWKTTGPLRQTERDQDQNPRKSSSFLSFHELKFFSDSGLI